MNRDAKRRTLGPPLSAWESTLEESDRHQAGEIEPGDETGGGGDKGIDAETGGGGYSGDAALAGHDDSVSQTDRPLDREIEGEPREYEDESERREDPDRRD